VGVAQTCGRPGVYNDNRFVEQRNSSLVRAYLGNMPLRSSAEHRAPNALYQDMRINYDVLQPVLRQTERKAFIGPDGIVHIRRKQDRARTPFQRLCGATPPISRKTREQLQMLYEQTHPMALKRSIHAQIDEIISMVASKEEALSPV